MNQSPSTEDDPTPIEEYKKIKHELETQLVHLDDSIRNQQLKIDALLSSRKIIADKVKAIDRVLLKTQPLSSTAKPQVEFSADTSGDEHYRHFYPTWA